VYLAVYLAQGAVAGAWKGGLRQDGEGDNKESHGERENKAWRNKLSRHKPSHHKPSRHCTCLAATRQSTQHGLTAGGDASVNMSLSL